MPRTAPKSSAQLGIELEDVRLTCFPGDALTGYVHCEAPTVHQSPSTTVLLKLSGRAKTKYTQTTQGGKSMQRGRAVFFEESQVLHKGPITCKDGGHHAWPFSITIPETSQAGFATRRDCDEFRVDSGFLHTYDANHKEIEVTRHPLPSIMYYRSASAMSGKGIEAYIEYVLHAESGDLTAAYPLYVRQRSVPSPIQDFKMQTRTFQKVIRTPRLLPEYASAPLTFGQKSGMLFRPSKTPRYGYVVKVEYPTVIQLEHPEPLPLKVYLIPDLDRKKTTICSNGDLSLLPPVKVVNMELSLRGEIKIRCPGMMWDSEAERNHTFNFNFREVPKSVDVPVMELAELQQIQSGPIYSSNSLSCSVLATSLSTPAVNIWAAHDGTEVVFTGESWQPLHPTTAIGCPQALDIGRHAAIFLGCSASSTLLHPPVSFKRQVYPTFSSYNIFIKYRLKWKLNLACAGEEHEVSGEAPVTVLPPSEEQEEQKKRTLGREGMKKNYDDLESGLGQAIQFVGQVLQLVG